MLVNYVLFSMIEINIKEMLVIRLELRQQAELLINVVVKIIISKQTSYEKNYQ